MRGKYAKRAETRRDWNALDERATTAERERDRLAAELAELRERAEDRITGLRHEVSGLRRQRDEAAAPRIAQLEEVNNRLRAERNEALDEARAEIDCSTQVQNRLADFLENRFGFGGPEAKETSFAICDGPQVGRRFMSGVGVSSTDPRMVEEMQRARGLRGSGNPAEETLPGLTVRVQDRRWASREAKRLRLDAVREVTPVYSFDGSESSLVLSVDDDTSLRIYIEHAKPSVLTNAGLAGIRIPPEERDRLAQVVAKEDS